MDSFVSGTNTFINFWLLVYGDTRRETQFLKVFSTHTLLTILSDHPPHGASRHVKISDSRDPKNPTTCSMVENSTLCLYARNSTLYCYGPISTDSFLKFSGQSLPGMTTSTLQPPFLVWGFIMTMVIVISFAHEHKTATNNYAPELLT